jgi:hypothetical protein
MPSIRKEVVTDAPAASVWDAIRDIGALHTRLVPGFVANTRLEPGARVVTFGNGTVLREPIVAIDESARRLVWTADGGLTSHYNAAVQVFCAGEEGSRVVWIADFLPETVSNQINAAMDAGCAAMKAALDRLAGAARASSSKEPRTGEEPAGGVPLEPFLAALSASGPAPDRGGNMELYAWLIGSWDLDVTRFLADGSIRRRPGEWHFGWVLEGRAIQDVWIVPPRGERSGDAAEQALSYGTTLRIYDPKLDAWRIHWIDPVTQTFPSMIGRRDEGGILQTGDDPTGNLIRWSFREIRGDSFLWRGEASSDFGVTWQTQVEFRARRSLAR